MQAVVIGATGAVGSALVAELIKQPSVKKITLLGRRPATLPAGDTSKVVQHQVDMFDVKSYRQHLAGHTVAFSTLGVGEPSKMSPEEFAKIDYECVRDFGHAFAEAGGRRFYALTAVGANPGSRVHYLRVKGFLERDLSGMGFERVGFFEPSMIMTPENRYGFTQAIALKIFPTIDHVLVGGLSKYRSVKVGDLGRCIALAAVRAPVGRGAEPTVVERFQWTDYQKLLK